MRSFPLVCLALVGLAACGNSGAADRARLLEWRKLTIEQALRCDEPLFAMMKAMRDSDFVEGSTQASRTARVCREATVALSAFGDLPGEGPEKPSSVAHPCGLDTMATAEAAERTVALIDGDVRPSVQAGIRESITKRGTYMEKCKADMDARARSLDVPLAELTTIVEDAREKATGSRRQMRASELLAEDADQNK